MPVAAEVAWIDLISMNTWSLNSGWTDLISINTGAAEGGRTDLLWIRVGAELRGLDGSNI